MGYATNWRETCCNNKLKKNNEENKSVYVCVDAVFVMEAEKWGIFTETERRVQSKSVAMIGPDPRE